MCRVQFSLLKLTQNALMLFPTPLRVLGCLSFLTDISTKTSMTGYSYHGQSKIFPKLVKSYVNVYKK